MSAPKRTLIFLTLVVIFSLVLTACQTNTSGTETPVDEPASAPESNITVVIAEDPPSFNTVIADTVFDSLVMELVMLRLSDIDPDGNIFPELAAELPTLENGGVVQNGDGAMSVTWKMRQDVQWADGTPVTADDVIFTYEALIDPELGGWIPGLDYIDSVEKVDDYTFIVNYTSVYPGYLTQFGGEQV